jgi:hypothetical protein
VFISAMVNDNELLVFDLRLVSLEPSKTPVRSVPLIYSGSALKSEHEKASKLKSVAIAIKQSPQ